MSNKRSNICRLVTFGFMALYVLALFLFLVGIFGWFGNETDPLAGVFLLPLGMPWIWLVDSVPDKLMPWAMAACPALNFAILAAVCRRHLSWAA